MSRNPNESSLAPCFARHSLFIGSLSEGWNTRSVGVWPDSTDGTGKVTLSRSIGARNALWYAEFSGAFNI
jgi:hypothetical protein